MMDKVLNLFLKSFKRNEITGYEAFRSKGNKKFLIAPSIVIILQIIHHLPSKILHLNQKINAKPTTICRHSRFEARNDSPMMRK